MNKTFYLVRHAQIEKISGDAPLSELGKKQALKTAKYFQKLTISKIFASPLLRTQQTAQYIADALKLGFVTSDLLRERVNWGDDPTQTFEDFLTMWDQATKDRNWQPPIGDTSTNAGKRLELLIDNLLESGERDFLLVTHGGITTDFLRNIYSDSELVEYTNDSRLSVEDNIGECSVTIMKIDSDSKIKLVDFACINHLK